MFPHAPPIPVTINNGYVMPAWYDILEFDLERKVDESQLRASARAGAALIEREIGRGIDSRRIIVAGFSQGGAVGYEIALTFTKRLAGLVAISTYFATHDPMVLEAHGEASYRRLLEMGYPAEYRTYPVEHGVDLTEIRDIGDWIGNRLGDGNA